MASNATVGPVHPLPSLALTGKTALVTGANGSLGEHFARTLAGAGARVVLCARRPESLDAAVEAMRADGHEVLAVALDVTDRASVVAAFATVDAQFGPVSVLVNNAGIAVTKPLLEHTEDDWCSVIDTNLSGAWRVAQEGARRMVASGGGSIINIASILGVRVAAQVPAYVAAKAALIHLTQAMALELARHKVRVNALAPGYVLTQLNAGFFQTDAGAALVKRIPQRRVANPSELDGALLLLASEAGSAMTGSVITIDGGHLVSSL